MFQDKFDSAADSLIAPASDCFAIIPDDALDLPRATKALYIGTGGDIVVRPLLGDQDVILRNTIGGSILDIRVRAVRATNTTAQDIVGLI